MKKRKAFILVDLAVTTVILSALASIFLSTVLMSYETEKIDFIAQKRTFFDSMINKAVDTCKTTYDPNDIVTLYNGRRIMDGYYFYFSATCSKKEGTPDIYVVNYFQCVYQNEDGTGFVPKITDWDEYHNSEFCDSGERYVKI